MIRKILYRIRSRLTAELPPQGQSLGQEFQRDLTKHLIGGPPGSSDQALWTLLLQVQPSPDPPTRKESEGEAVRETSCETPAKARCRLAAQ